MVAHWLAGRSVGLGGWEIKTYEQGMSVREGEGAGDPTWGFRGRR